MSPQAIKRSTHSSLSETPSPDVDVAISNQPADRQTAGEPRPLAINASRLFIVLFILSLWEFLPSISWLRERWAVFDPFFVSSPSEVFTLIFNLATGRDGQPLLWPYLWDTLKGTFVGVAVGTILGAALGLILSNNSTALRISRPFVLILNATPRIALIPIFIIIAGPSLTANILTSIAVVFFLVFHNAFAGGASVPIQTVQNARLLGASPREVMLNVRLQYVLVWTFASLPNAISFGLVGVVTAEMLTGHLGMGRLLWNSVTAVNATLTFAVVVVLAAVGVILVTVADAIQSRALHWWEQS